MQRRNFLGLGTLLASSSLLSLPGCGGGGSDAEIEADLMQAQADERTARALAVSPASPKAPSGGLPKACRTTAGIGCKPAACNCAIKAFSCTV